MGSYKVAAMRDDDFDAASLNVIKLTRVADCEIAIAEIKYQVDRIKADIDARFGDSAWEESARIAMANMEHKGRMVAIKMATLIQERDDAERRRKENAAKVPTLPPEVVRAVLFKKAARVMLDDPTFEKVRAMADLSAEKQDR